MKRWWTTLVAVFGLLVIFSWGFVDPGLNSFASTEMLRATQVLRNIVFQSPVFAGLIFILLLTTLIISYVRVFTLPIESVQYKKIWFVVGALGVLGALAFPAFSYDVFNYITTAKVTYFHGENPYIVMPFEILNEPYLAFTRAANKVALYGPLWILLTSIPHYLGHNNIWVTILVFKLTNAFWYLAFSFLIYRVTKSMKNVLFFAFNPLILIEVLIAGHNDIVMMFLATIGLIVWFQKGLSQKIVGLFFLISSVLIKGATVVLLPLIFFRYLSRDRALFLALCLLSVVFFFAAPIREELYPWYAVWIISPVAFLDLKKYKNVVIGTMILTASLEFRHIPYMMTLSYAGWGVLFRILVSYVPVVLFLCYKVWNNRNIISSAMRVWKKTRIGQ